jgi:hypothetical protein
VKAVTYAIALACLGLLLAGCGSSKKAASPPPSPTLPNARTPDQWARRIVDLFLRPLNRDLVVLNSYDNPQVRVYIISRNAQTLRIIHQRLGDLRGCTGKLATIGPPPSGEAALARVDRHFKTACKSYEDVAGKLLEATDSLASGDADKTTHGQRLVASARPASRRAADELLAGIKVAQSLPPFRRAGLKPSV